MAKKKAEFSLKRFLVTQLRRSSYRFPERTKAYQAARVSRGHYLCNGCKKIFGRREVVADHIIPVVDPEKGWTDWDDFIQRLFCDVTGLQILCKPCHYIKSQGENKIRREKARQNKLGEVT